MEAPIAKKIPHVIHRHGTTRQDNYYWLRDKNWQTICQKGRRHFVNKEIVEYIEAENQYTEYVMQDTSDLQEKLYAEFLNHIQESDSSAPIKHGPYFYYTRTQSGQNYPIYCRKKCTYRADLAGAKEHIWLDVNAVASQRKAKHFQMG